LDGGASVSWAYFPAVGSTPDLIATLIAPGSTLAFAGPPAPVAASDSDVTGTRQMVVEDGMVAGTERSRSAFSSRASGASLSEFRAHRY
jgi:hypothetical protein